MSCSAQDEFASARVAYLANLFPSPLEPYVVEEIQELRKCGIEVVPCSARRASASQDNWHCWTDETVYLQPLQLVLAARAMWLCLRRISVLRDFSYRALFTGSESPSRRLRALLHTWLGTYYALALRNQRIAHIHVQLLCILGGDGGSAAFGHSLQHDPPRIRFTAARCVPRPQVGALQFVRDHLRIQSQTHSGTVPASGCAKSCRQQNGSRFASN